MSPQSDDWHRTLMIEQTDLDRAKALLAKGYLTVIRGSSHDLGRYLVIESSVSIGRGSEVDLQLQDNGVSRRHLSIARDEDGAYLLSDLGSTNGTFLAGERVKATCALRDSDKIFVGNSVLRFALADDIDLGYQTEVAQILGQDPLTGLESKRRFDDALSFAVAQAQRGSQALAIFMMDMDGVKSINDTHGHFFGAHVIGETGRIIARHLSAGGHACRFGGDEFCAFLPGLDGDGAWAVAETIRKAVEGAGMEKDGIPLAPTISIGISFATTQAEEPTDLLSRADAALYRAKAAGKNRTAA